MDMYMMQNKRGFTLIEILVALLIFTILSAILVSALHQVINIQASVEANAERLRKLQFALLTMSRDIEQTVNRPVLMSSGKKQAVFMGSPQQFTLTHTGSSLVRVTYTWSNHSLWRMKWDKLDQMPDASSAKKLLMANVENASFQYLDRDGRFRNDWPAVSQADKALPRAVRVMLTLSNWGTLSQIYVISAES
jgi:general secretion pathway protein J